jgi:uncharacterized protein (DUF433 family)
MIANLVRGPRARYRYSWQTQAFVAKAPPLVADEDGVIRVVGTRVQLETVVVGFDAGATAEEIAQQYTSLDLPDVYSVISYVRQRGRGTGLHRGAYGVGPSAARRSRAQHADRWDSPAPTRAAAADRRRVIRLLADFNGDILRGLATAAGDRRASGSGLGHTWR